LAASAVGAARTAGAGALALGREWPGRGKPVRADGYVLNLLGRNRSTDSLFAGVATEARALDDLRDGLRGLAIGQMIEHPLPRGPIVIGLRLGGGIRLGGTSSAPAVSFMSSPLVQAGRAPRQADRTHCPAHRDSHSESPRPTKKQIGIVCLRRKENFATAHLAVINDWRRIMIGANSSKDLASTRSFSIALAVDGTFCLQSPLGRDRVAALG
jgi:hypothetical protein